MNIVSKFVGKHTNEEGQLDKPINILPPLVLTILYILKLQTQLDLLCSVQLWLSLKQHFSSAEDWGCYENQLHNSLYFHSHFHAFNLLVNAMYTVLPLFPDTFILPTIVESQCSVLAQKNSRRSLKQSAHVMRNSLFCSGDTFVYIIAKRQSRYHI